MSWYDVDQKVKRKIDSNFVSCTENYELRDIFKIIKEEYPELEDGEIWDALDRCCAENPAPRPRDEYMECVRKKLGK